MTLLSIFALLSGTKKPIIPAITTGTTQLNPRGANGKLFTNGTLANVRTLISNAIYVANLNTLSFLILSVNNESIIIVTAAG